MEQNSRAQDQDLQHIWIVIGPAGCGKTTVGMELSKELQMDYIEGDDYHPRNNKEKMEKGQPLDDNDRKGWLVSLREAAMESLQTSSGVVMSCSALKKKYRDIMRGAADEHPTVKIHFIFLDAEEEVLHKRVTARKSHFMPPSLVCSQVKTLEKPNRDSEPDVVTVPCDDSRAAVRERVFAAVNKIMEDYN
ncbi:thermoresistant gluconokinase [Paracoccidioides lutzii Pb01]|uniref:Gluconokinase n=1 Tax=Paracoccidioides lutzii (strain ATCC MYA-826 / Pb01) TaxID=502779 RepID=C1GW75_PARBA|nr:thermoresistant gluconokinase [Paracoccidioides lutzii Pb01]EEH40794.1 thermoresistant gluconokinase [Paracoccidioides lutzii Pb01]